MKFFVLAIGNYVRPEGNRVYSVKRMRFFQFFQPVMRVISLTMAALPRGARIQSRLHDAVEDYPWLADPTKPRSVRKSPSSAIEANLGRLKESLGHYSKSPRDNK